MRKDEIEDRIGRIEEEIRRLKSDHRDGVDSILTELRGFQRFIIEEQIESVKKQLAEGYENVFVEMLVGNAEKALDENCTDPCTKERYAECREFFASRLREAAKFYQHPESPAGQDSDAHLLIENPVFTKTPCNVCFNVYLHEKERLKQTIGKLSGCRKSLSAKKEGVFLSSLPDGVVISTVIEPLSHETRFAMLKALSTGSMSFKELSELTGSKGGHLIYHLNILLNAGYVIKTDAGKRYSITDRGLRMMELIKKLYTES